MTFFKDQNLQASPERVAQVFKDVILTFDRIDQEKEHYLVMHIDTRSKIKMVEVVSIGTVNSSLVHPRETFRRAVVEGSTSILIAHNHPSGDPEPSDADTQVTKSMNDAGNILGITMLDHLIIGKDSYFTFRDNQIKAYINNIKEMKR